MDLEHTKETYQRDVSTHKRDLSKRLINTQKRPIHTTYVLLGCQRQQIHPPTHRSFLSPTYRTDLKNTKETHKRDRFTHPTFGSTSKDSRPIHTTHFLLGWQRQQIHPPIYKTDLEHTKETHKRDHLAHPTLAGLAKTADP